MTFRVAYKQDLTDAAGSEAERRWTMDVTTDPAEFASALTD